MDGRGQRPLPTPFDLTALAVPAIGDAPTPGGSRTRLSGSLVGLGRAAVGKAWDEVPGDGARGVVYQIEMLTKAMEDILSPMSNP